MPTSIFTKSVTAWSRYVVKYVFLQYLSSLYQMHSVQSPSCRLMMNINEKPECMEVDTGATLSIMSHRMYLAKWPYESAPPIESSDAKPSMYTVQRIGIVGAMNVDVEYHGQTAHNRLVILDGYGPTLLGRDWLRHFRLDWASCIRLTPSITANWKNCSASTLTFSSQDSARLQRQLQNCT